MTSDLSKKFLTILLGLFFVTLYIPQLSADEDSPDAGDVIDMVAGDIQAVPVNNLNRVSVTNPDVAEIADATSDKVSVLAKKAGTTILFLWDDGGKHSVKVRVVNEDLTAVKERLQKLLDEAGITGVTLEENMDEGKIVLEGTMSKEDKARLGDLIEPYSDNLLNLVKIEKSEELVEVDMQVVEVSTTLEQNLGIQWVNSNGTAATGSTSSGQPTTSAASAGLALPYDEHPPSTNGKVGDFFKVGSFNRNFQLQATVNALLQEGKAKLISKPRLVVVSGKEASFLVGGEIPQNNTSTSASGGTTTSSTTYTQYGVNMKVTPTIRNGKIDVELNVDIRDIDSSSNFSTASNPAFITRTASTDLLLDNKQTIALAGLIKYAESETLSEVPFLSKIPLVGGLFRDRNIPGDANTEMVIVLTATVLTDKKIADKQLVMPTPADREAYKQFDAKYEHEPLPTWPLPKVIPPAPVKNAEDFGAMTAYARMVQVKISKAISYPQAAMGQSLSGTVKLKLHILKDGSLDSEELMESSGNDILDQDALHAAKTAAPYDAFTTGIDQDDLIFTIPIVYNKLIAGSQAPAEKVIASY